MNIGFIGYGRHAKNNLYPALKLLGKEVQAVTTRHMETAQQAVSDQNAKVAYDNDKEMFEKEKLDCVFISTQPEEQAPLVLAALDNGVHVFVEKPLGMSLKEAEQIEKKSKETGKFVMVGFMKRFAPNYVEMRRLVSENILGDIVSINAIFSSRNFTTSSKEYLLFAAIHSADMVSSFLGEIDTVHAFEHVVGDSISLAISCVDKSGLIANMSFTGTPSWAKLNEQFFVTGTNGYAYVSDHLGLNYHINSEVQSEQPRWQIIDEVETRVGTVTTTGSGGFQDLYMKGFVGEVEHFLNCVESGSEPQTSAKENVKTMRLVEKILEAIGF